MHVKVFPSSIIPQAEARAGVKSGKIILTLATHPSLSACIYWPGDIIVKLSFLILLAIMFSFNFLSLLFLQLGFPCGREGGSGTYIVHPSRLGGK